MIDGIFLHLIVPILFPKALLFAKSPSNVVDTSVYVFISPIETFDNVWSISTVDPEIYTSNRLLLILGSSVSYKPISFGRPIWNLTIYVVSQVNISHL